MADSRDRLIASGVALVIEGGPGALARVLKTEEVCLRAGLSRRTFYDQFVAASEFHDAVSQALRAEVGDESAGNEFDFDDLLAGGAEAEDLLRAMLANFAEACAEVERIRFWEPDRGSPLQRSIAKLLAAIEGAGYRPVLEGGSSVVGGALEALFHAASKGVLNEAAAVAALSTLVTASHVRRDLANPLESSKAALFAELRASRLQPANELVLNLRRLVVDTTLEAIERLGPDQVTLDDIARRVGVSAGTIAVTMGTVVELATAGLEELAVAVAVPLQADLGDGLVAAELVNRHVSRLTELLRSRPYMIELILLAESRRNGRPLEVLARSGEVLIEAGLFDRDGLERATLVLTTLVRRGDAISAEIFSSIAIGGSISRGTGVQG